MSVVSEHNGKKMYKHRNLLYGAAGGLIRIFDERDGSQTTCDCEEFELRAEALGLEAKRCIYPEERIELTNAANEMEEAAAAAAAQGNPLDPKVQAYHQRHGKKNTILVGAGTVPLKGPKLPPPPSSLLKGAKLLSGAR